MSDKLRLDYFLSVGGKLAAGDECYNIRSNEPNVFEGTVQEGDVFAGQLSFSGVGFGIYDEHSQKKLVITSFAERENKGEQPVSDDFPVIATHSIGDCIGPASVIYWSDRGSLTINAWKPDYEALLKMQAEHDKHNESIVKACDEANKKESEMVYTQEMFDNNIAPKRDMKVLVGGLEPDSRIIDFEGASVTIVNVHSASNLITFSHGLIGCGCGYFYAEKKVFHPIKTPEEIELEEAKKKQIEKMCFKYKNLPLEVAMQMQENGDLPEIVINDLSARGMAKQ